MAYWDLNRIRNRLLEASALASLIAFLSGSVVTAQNFQGNGPTRMPASFPTPDIVLRDASHKEPKSGVQLQGGQLTIASGVGTPTAINVLSFSADGKILAAGKDFGRVVLWNVAEKKFLRAIETDQGIVNAVSMSADGKSLATSGNQDHYSAKIWDASSGTLVWTFKESTAPIHRLFFDAEGKWLVIESNASNVLVVDMVTHKIVATIPDIHTTAMSRDGKTLVTSDGKEFAVWSPPTWTKTQAVAKSPVTKNYSLLLAADPGKDQLAFYEMRSIRTIQLSTGQTVLNRNDLVSKSFTSAPDFGAFSTDATLLYLSLDSRLTILSTKSRDVCTSPVMYSGAAALSPDGRWFAGAKNDSIMSKERTDGVWVWSNAELLKKCGFELSPIVK